MSQAIMCIKCHPHHACFCDRGAPVEDPPGFGLNAWKTDTTNAQFFGLDRSKGLVRSVKPTSWLSRLRSRIARWIAP